MSTEYIDIATNKVLVTQGLIRLLEKIGNDNELLTLRENCKNLRDNYKFLYEAHEKLKEELSQKVLDYNELRITAQLLERENKRLKHKKL